MARRTSRCSLARPAARRRARSREPPRSAATHNRPRPCAARLEAPSGAIPVGGTANAAGMTPPTLAAPLAVLTADAVAEPATLAPPRHRVADRTFNAISVGGDTST